MYVLFECVCVNVCCECVRVSVRYLSMLSLPIEDNKRREGVKEQFGSEHHL
jgi:hypothetical protein